MTHDIVNVVGDRIGEKIYRQTNLGRELLLHGEFYRGFLELARAYTNKWGRRDHELHRPLADLRLSDSDINTLRTGMESSLANIDRILSIGEVFQPEELLLALQQRLDIKLIMAMLKGYYNINLEIDCSQADESIRLRLRKSVDKRNNKLYRLIYGVDVIR